MKRFVFGLLALFILVGCPATLPCSQLKPVTDALAVRLAQPDLLNCKNVEAMKADLIAICAEKGICKANAKPLTAKDLKGPIAEIVCPIVVPYVVSLIGTQIPPTWECTGSGAEAAIMAACKAIPY